MAAIESDSLRGPASSSEKEPGRVVADVVRALDQEDW
jgi:hypothetical protein